MLDGFVVNIGDNVWDVLLANTGIVTAIDGGATFTVDFGPQGSLMYASGGTVAGRKRAYWRNPVILTPRKLEPRWASITQAATIIRDAP